MCILSLINKIPVISAQILFILHKSHKIHRIFIYTPQIPHTTASTGGLECYFLGGGFGDGGGNWYICGEFFIPNRSLGLMGDFGLLVNVIIFDDEKDFDWAAFGGGLCEFGLG